MESLKRNVLFSFLYTPPLFFPDDLALRSETGQSEVDVNVVGERVSCGVSEPQQGGGHRVHEGEGIFLQAL